jgi:hypothetical protein
LDCKDDRVLIAECQGFYHLTATESGESFVASHAQWQGVQKVAHSAVAAL